MIAALALLLISLPAQGQPVPDPDARQQQQPAPDDEAPSASEGQPAPAAADDRESAMGDAVSDAQDTSGENADATGSSERRGEADRPRSASVDMAGSDTPLPHDARAPVHDIIGTYCVQVSDATNPGRTLTLRMEQTYNADHTFTVAYVGNVHRALPQITGGHWEYRGWEETRYGGWNMSVELRTDQHPPMQINFRERHIDAAVFVTDYLRPWVELAKCS